VTKLGLGIKYCISKATKLGLGIKYCISKVTKLGLTIKYCISKVTELGMTIKYCISKVTELGLAINPLNPELNPICYLLALLAHHFLHVSRIRVKSLTLDY